jgi:formin 2
MKQGLVARAFLGAAGLTMLMVATSFAGGPVCPPSPACHPVGCASPSPYGPPPSCAPVRPQPPGCGPAYTPPRCESSSMLGGCVDVLKGICSLPFRLCGGVAGMFCSESKPPCGPTPPPCPPRYGACGAGSPVPPPRVGLQSGACPPGVYCPEAAAMPHAGRPSYAAPPMRPMPYRAPRGADPRMVGPRG